ncbi:MAG: 3-ketoacyl-ACP synthase, partial [Odoribacter sp.]|nr:3-ketoacyl-ACP synthase [Odoribacter sp.]
MAFLKIKNVAIRGVSACVPKKIVENSDSVLFSQEELKNLFYSVGIERRRCVDEGMCTSDLCFTAAEKVLEELSWNKSEIDALVFVSQTPDYRNPATSCILQDRLGLPVTCMSLDISLGCSGYVYGLSVLSSIMSGGNIKKAQLLVGDTTSLTSSPEDKSRVLLFGDAGTCTAMEFDVSACEMNFHLASDGSGYQAIMTPDSGFRHRITPDSFRLEDFGEGIKRARVHSLLDGMEVFSFGIYRAPQTVNSLCARYGLDKEKFDYFLFHQANLMMNEKIRKKLKLPEEKVPYNLKNFGNTSCASIPLLMVTNLRDELESREISAILCAFG